MDDRRSQRFRNGLVATGAGMTLDEVARELGISKQAVNQIERKALAKVRIALQERGLTLEMLI